MAHPKVLLTGASGFVGGTVLNQLINSHDSNIKSLPITAIVRQQRQQALLAEKGIPAIVVDGFDDVDGLTKAASEHDIVVDAANGFHTVAAMALIEGLGKRVKETGSDAHFIHISGTTSVSVPSLSPSPFEPKTFSDRDDDVYEYEVIREKHQPYNQRSNDLAVIHKGEALGVKTYIVMPPLVYGRGTGLFNNQSQQIPSLIRNAINTGYSAYIGTGKGLLGHVHVADLGLLFHCIVGGIVSGEKLPSGRKGFYFAEPGRHSWADLSALIGASGSDLGALQSRIPRSMRLQDAAEIFCGGDEMMTEICFATNSSTEPDRSYNIGWKPLRTELDFEESITDTFKEILKDPAIDGGHLFSVKLH